MCVRVRPSLSPSLTLFPHSHHANSTQPPIAAAPPPLDLTTATAISTTHTHTLAAAYSFFSPSERVHMCCGGNGGVMAGGMKK